jgi:hypothetical protein
VSNKRNPLDELDFKCGVDDDGYYFDDDSWNSVRAQVKSELRAMQVSWDEFYDWPVDDWLAMLLPKAGEAMINFWDDIPHESQADLHEQMEHTLRAFKKQLGKEERTFENWEAGLEHAKHFKIYPENGILKEYLRKGGVSKLSKYCEVLAVYPATQPTDNATNGGGGVASFGAGGGAQGGTSIFGETD